MTPNELMDATGMTPALAGKWYVPLSEVKKRFELDTVTKMAYFLAQVGHESAGFVHVRELWGPTEAQKRYEGRKDLGNTQPGDGFKFRGRGLIQITGRYNYGKMSKTMGLPLLDRPELLEEPNNATMSAGHFWESINGNSFAIAGDFEGLTRKINGGLNGFSDRKVRLERAMKVLMVSECFLQC